MLLQPRGKVRERREKLRDHDFRPVDVDDFDDFRGGGRLERGDVCEQALPILRGPDVEVMNHHHASECDFLRDLTPRAMFGQAFQDAVFRGKFSACYQLGRTGTLTAKSASKTFGPALHGQYIVVGARHPQRRP